MIKFTAEDRVGSIVISRAAQGNAFTSGMVRDLTQTVLSAARTTDILTLAGEGADFTVGRDRQEPRSGSPFDAFSNISELNQAIAEYPGILVTVVRGRVFGLGVGLIMRSDLAIATDDAQFALDEVELGIPPMFIMEAILDHLPPKRAFDIVLTSRSFNAAEALKIGMVSRIVPKEHFDNAVDDLVNNLQSRDRNVILACKRYLRSIAKLPSYARLAFALVEQTQFALSKH